MVRRVSKIPPWEEKEERKKEYEKKRVPATNKGRGRENEKRKVKRSVKGCVRYAHINRRRVFCGPEKCTELWRNKKSAATLSKRIQKKVSSKKINSTKFPLELAFAYVCDISNY